MFQVIPQAVPFDSDLLRQMKRPTNMNFGDTHSNHIVNESWATFASAGQNSAKHQVKTDHLDFTRTLPSICEWPVVPASCLYSVRLLHWCVYEIISILLFLSLSNPVVKHLPPPPPALGEPVTLYSEKQP